MNRPTPEKGDKQPAEHEETLEERSRRLEAEASEGRYDPLAPEPESAQRESADMIVLKQELDQAKDQMMRALAEAENTRKRASREREEGAKYAISGFSRDILSVADNLRRALEAIPDDVKDDVRIRNLIDGIEATERELLKNFEKYGIKKLDPIGSVFDPNFHEVMFEIPATGKPPGTVMQVIEVGYTLHDRLLRPARVGVAKDESKGGGSAPPPPAEPGGHIDTEA